MLAEYRPVSLEAAGGSGSQDRVEDGANSRVPLVGMRGLVSLYSCNRLTSSHNMVVSMANTTKRTIASPHWLDVKARWKATNMFKGWVCHSLGCDSREGLSLHHWTYARLGNEQLSDLILVCSDCHSHIHRLERRGMSLDEATKKVAGQLPYAG